MELSDFLIKIEGKNQPVVAFVQGTDEATLRLVKQILQRKVADIILLGNEADVAEACYVYQINDTLLYGVINPKNHPEKEYYVGEYKKLHPEQTNKEISKRLNDPEIFANLMLHLGKIDMFFVD
jgi:phosphotransacetylase